MKNALRALSVIVAAVTLAFASDGATVAIRVDQVGYLAGLPKIAIVAAPGRTFTVRRASDRQAEFSGKLSAPVKDADTGDTVQLADFSRLRDSGTYFLEVPGVGKSWPFSIGSDVFSRAYYLAMRAFYGQRCGTRVDLGAEFAGYSHPACHTNGRFHPSSGRQGERANVGGWHDAGDYGRYLPTSGIATGALLWTWELFGDRLKDIRLDLPETGNGTPDLLNEARWNLEWMLKMQDADGGVWHKQTSVNFPSFIMPEKDSMPSEVVGSGRPPYKTTCATADLAAVSAIAARTYGPFDPKFAEANLVAARKAWEWTEKYPNETFRNPAGVATGEYGDNDCSDERLWAAVELWRTTGDAAYHRYFREHYSQYLDALSSPPGANWAQLAPMGLWSYVLAGRKESDPVIRGKIRKRAITAAQTIVSRTGSNPYRVAMTSKDYVWGSNSVAGNYGMQLLVTNRLSPDPAYVEAAADHLHYLLGRNTFSLSWVTQVGGNPFRHPHHRPSGADDNEEPWPGLLSGGPNAGRQDAVLRSLPAGLPPAKVYRDDQDSYSGNEVAINWQAMLVFLLAGQLR